MVIYCYSLSRGKVEDCYNSSLLYNAKASYSLLKLFERCGGCMLRGIHYATYLAKKSVAESTLVVATLVNIPPDVCES